MEPVGRLQAAVDALAGLEARVDERPGEVHLLLDGPVARIRLDNPRAHNAMTVRMMRQLAVAVHRLARWDGTFVVVESAHGGSFCAGGHLGQVREALVEPDAARTMTDAMTTVLDTLLALPPISVAILEGPAIGGGVEVATACDLRAASERASLHLAQVQLGVATGWGGARRLVRHLGRPTALRLLARAERIDARGAQALGLVDHVGTGDAEALLRGVLGPALEHPGPAVLAAKAQIDADSAEAQADAFLSVWGSAAHRSRLVR